MKGTMKNWKVCLVTLSLSAVLSAAPGSFSLRDFRQLYASLSAATGIAPSQTLREYFQGAQYRLLNDGDPVKFNATTLMTTISLTGLFCDELLTAELNLPAAERRVFQVLDFSQGPSSVTHENQVAFVTREAEVFWARDPEPLELAALMESWGELASFSANSPTGLREMALSICTAVGSSSDSIRF